MSLLRICALLTLLAATSGCGAGLITGAVASNGNTNSAPAARPPVLTVPEPRLPLQPATAASASARTVVIANASLPANANLLVQVRAQGIAADQASPVVLFGQSGSTVIGFQLRTQPFAAAFGTGQDVPATLAVVVDGREIAAPVPVLLLRQPQAQLLDPSSRLLLSPLGGTRAQLRVRGLRSQDNLQMTVTTADPTGQSPSVTRVCTGLETTVIDADTMSVAADVPGNTFAGSASFVVEDLIAGRSTTVADAFYRPEIDVALPGQGPATGGTLVTLIGRALAPLDFTTEPPLPDLDRILLQFRKGGRAVDLAASELRRSESSVDRLVFTMPPSPDGRPGPLDIVLSVQPESPASPPVTVQTNLFLFASREPVFGPRGAVLDLPPVAVAPIELENAPLTGAAPDFGVLYAQGGVGYLQLLAAQENGMFIRFGPPQRLGNPDVVGERGPGDLATGDLDGDQVPDFLAVNAGGAQAVHQIVLGQSAPLAPLGAQRRILTPGGVARTRLADFDRDGRLDVLLVPSSGAGGALPRVLLARSVVGAPQFVDAGTIAVRDFAYEAIEVADIDGDQRLDVALLGGGVQPRLDIAYGFGNGSFAVATQIDLTIPNYSPDASSVAVGVHCIRGGGSRSMAVILSGLPPAQGQAPPHPTTPPVVAVLEQQAPRSFALPQPAVPANSDPGSVLIVPLEPIGTSLGADLDHDNSEELVIGVRETSTVPIGLLRFVPAAAGRRAHFQPVPNGIQQGSEPIRRVTALHYGVASPANPTAGRAAVRAVFVVHESETDGVPERRISTLLVFDSGAPPPNNGLTLLSADGGGPLSAPLLGVAAGNFRPISVGAADGNVAARDLALATSGSAVLARGVIVLGNDGFGGFGPSLTMSDPQMVPATLVRLPAAKGQIEAMAYLDNQGQVGIWRPDDTLPSPQAPTWRIAGDLRQLSSDPRLQNAAVDPSSVLRAADVDGDGALDLVVLLRLQVSAPRTEGDALLVILRGAATASAGSSPFLPATVATPVHGNAAGLALGNFVLEPLTAQRTRMELALAVPTGTQPSSLDGDHVRFYRLDVSSSGSQWLRSFDPQGQQVLVAGNQPTQLAAADFDRNGTDDLLVASAGDSLVRLFLNSGAAVGSSAEVAIEAFHQSFTSPVPTGPGMPLSLRLGDINSDGNVDVLLTTEARANNGTASTAAAFYLSSGTGELSGPNFISRTRLGDRDGRLAIDLADCNGDGVPDIAGSWNTFGIGDRNVRVLFGGSK